jgi:hypothetical protein
MSHHVEDRRPHDRHGRPAPLTLAGAGMTALPQARAVDRGRDLDPSRLHVVVPYCNQDRWASRKRLHDQFMAWIASSGASVHVVELAIGDMPFEVTYENNASHLQLRTAGPIPWIKENLINLGIHRLLPKDADYVAWIDGDVRLENPYWATDTLHELQHAGVVQLFSEALDVGPNFEVVAQESGPSDAVRRGIVKHYLEYADPLNPVQSDKAVIHCGFAWAARRDFLAALDPYDPLIDYSFIGAADWQMAWAFLGNAAYGLHGGVCESFRNRVLAFGRKCDLHLKGRVGYVPGLLRHHWHGHKAARQYVSRWDMVVKADFDPDLDLAYDREGVLHITDRNPRLALLQRAYARSRNEDAI